MSPNVEYGRLDAERYCWFRGEAGWDVPSLARAKNALKASLDIAVIAQDEVPVAMARVIGDGAMNLYLQDVITARVHRRRGYASQIVSSLIERMQNHYDPEVTVGLLAAVGQESLYAKFGFQSRPSDIFGPGMNAPLGALSSAVRAV